MGLLSIVKGIVFFLVFAAIVFSVVLLVFDGKIPALNKAKNNNNKKNDSKGAKGTSNKSKDDSKKGEVKIATTQEFLDFEDIQIFNKDNPMGIIVRNNKTEFIGIVEVFGINYNLLSVEEREILEVSFGKLLNGIDYPIQIYVQSRKLDIDKYENRYEARLGEIKKNIDSLTSRYNFATENNENGENNAVIVELADKINKLTNQYNYGEEIKEYMMARSKQKNILERKYYLVITHKHNNKMFEEALTYEELLKNAFFDIANKANSIISSLQRSKLGGKMLNAVELGEVLYSAYNKSESSIYKISNALKSQFSHLYTTATPVELKTIARQIDEVERMKDEELRKLRELQEKEQEEAEGYYDLDIDIEDDFEEDEKPNAAVNTSSNEKNKVTSDEIDLDN